MILFCNTSNRPTRYKTEMIMKNITVGHGTGMQKGADNDNSWCLPTHTLTSGFKLTSNYNTPDSLFVQAHIVKCSNTYSLFLATYLDHPVEAFYDWEQNLFVSLAQPEPSDLLVAGYEPAVGMPWSALVIAVAEENWRCALVFHQENYPVPANTSKTEPIKIFNSYLTSFN